MLCPRPGDTITQHQSTLPCAQISSTKASIDAILWLFTKQAILFTACEKRSTRGEIIEALKLKDLGGRGIAG